MTCPACGFRLRPARAGDLTYAECELCGGVSVDTLRSLQLWAALHDARAPTPAEVGPDVPRQAEHCWKCSGSLEAFAYMEDASVSAQRCGKCRLLWVPGDVQAQARALWAKRVGREAVRLDRKADVSAAYRPSIKRVAGMQRSRVFVSSDATANAEYLRNERERERQS